MARKVVLIRLEEESYTGLETFCKANGVTLAGFIQAGIDHHRDVWVIGALAAEHCLPTGPLNPLWLKVIDMARAVDAERRLRTRRT